MMKCKKALEAENGDYEKAVDRLRKEGLKAAESKAGRATADGLVAASMNETSTRGGMVSVLCETEPVSKTPLFVEFVQQLAGQVNESGPSTIENLLAQPWQASAGETVDETLRGLIAKLGENMRVSQAARVEVKGTGFVGHYVHFNGKTGALAALKVGAVTPEIQKLASELCMHIVAKKPKAMSRQAIPAAVREKELEIAKGQLEADPKMKNKPPQVLEKILEGKLDAFYKENVVTEQEWLMDDKLSVAEVLKKHGAVLQDYRLFEVGA
jgi:elongation factor Ts